MQDKLLVALVIAILFIIFKFLDIRFSKNEKISPKHLAKESMFTFVSSIGALYLVEYFGLLSNNIKKQPNAFLDDPNF
tara:strand:- start:531 stop:764 length:234 start_codon:yes stop_codon:yes gene_type:complete